MATVSTDTGPFGIIHLDGQRQGTPLILVEIQSYDKDILRACHRPGQGIALGYQLWQRRGGNGVPPFVLRLQEARESSRSSRSPLSVCLVLEGGHNLFGELLKLLDND